MDITRGNLDDISRPASSSRAHLGSRASSASLEVLTPEPCLSKVDYQGDLDSDHKQDNSGKSSPEEKNQDNSREKYKTQKMRTLQQTMEEETTCIFQQMQNSELSEYISSSDSGEDCVETEPPNLNEASQEMLTNVKEEVSEEKDVDPKIQEAIRKMNKLDKILAKKQSQERTIKKQGREMRTKLWEELQCVIILSASGSHEEIENTNNFLALTSSLHERADCQNEMETSGLFNKAEKSHYESNTRSKKNQDFIKKNIELAKDSGNQVVMLEEEKKRLIELLKGTEDGSELQDTEEDASGWLVAGEGYTPEPMEFHHLNEIDAKLQIIVSNGDSSAIHSSCSKVPSQIYQESLAYANRNLEAAPGEKVLRDTKEQRDQQIRLKEIDQQLKNLLGNLPEELPCLSEEQLKTLLEECMQSQRTISNVPMSKSQELLSDENFFSCYTTQDATLLSMSTLSNPLGETHSVRMSADQEKAGLEDKNEHNCAENESPGFSLTKAMADSHLSKDLVVQTEEPNDLESLQEIADKSSAEGYFMSRALGTKSLKRPSFLDEPFYGISVNNELSTEADIPSIPLQTKGDGLKVEDAAEE
ncbi:PREDICTED: fibrous sheath-interacting protein 1 isoform X1 [Crocodylus porosus]|uniref:Fibrous sheath-interacting protein 1 n=2 Tax=Crocodylus porosus TaxID=8502 RepID=A0A7M4FP83_CROPO|nr:PREDICTED: fibrous sheath-interacting protein 1 isoform X1 [Crocodylus porosus]XP_019406910.1 PREDICTED: fibrous sheath-interacting protein 1 isoform X1 [Crocodylus porosus]XP_019406911.1 PREDICTED: fibrous sheath-interacting protein 1 isoform X1 [Crocodylus porosus]XP_019406912.1 PREDICTED: fibrous sheath-interacting protein 1 isoform X1 [Crocodylus porosus]